MATMAGLCSVAFTLRDVRLIIKEVKALLNELQTLMEETIRKIDVLDTAALHSSKVRLAIFTLQGVCREGCGYIMNAIEFIKCACYRESIDLAKAGIQSGNCLHVEFLLYEMQSYLNSAMDYYTKFDESCTTTNESALKAYQECYAKRKAVRRAGLAIGVTTAAAGVGATAAGAAVGGAAAVGTVLAVGTSLSLVSAPVTMGLGTIVGLGVTGAVAGAVGVTGLATTAVVGWRARVVSKRFRRLGDLFLVVSENACVLYDGLGCIKLGVDICTKKMDNLSRCLSQSDAEIVCAMLDVLCSGCSEVDLSDLISFEEKCKATSEKLNRKMCRLCNW